MAISFIATYIATVLLVPQTGTIEKKQTIIPSREVEASSTTGTRVQEKSKETKSEKKEGQIVLRKAKKHKIAKNKKGKKKSGKEETVTEYDNENLNDIYKKEREYFETGRGPSSKKRKKVAKVSGPLASIPLAVADAIAKNVAIANTPKVESQPVVPEKVVEKTPDQVLNVEDTIQDSKGKKKVAKKEKKSKLHKEAKELKTHKVYKEARVVKPEEVKKELQQEVQSAEIKEILKESSSGERAPSAVEVDTKTLLKTIEKKYTSHFIKIDIKSEVTQALLEKTKTYSGNLFLAPEGRFKMDIKEPNKHMLLMNGKNIWVVDYPLDETQDKVQILHSKSAKNLKSQGFLDIFSGVGNIQKKFKIESSDKKNDEITYKLIPKEKDGQVERVELKVDYQAELINSVAFWDSLGNKTQLKFSEQEFEDKTPKEVFKFKPPKNSSITYL